MLRRPPRPTRTATRFADTTLFRSSIDQADLEIARESVMLQTIVTDDEVNIVIAQQHLCGSHAVRCDHHRTARALSDQQRFVAAGGGIGIGAHRKRSEEHTSELQSLMRISYAVFCLKTKTIKK